MNSKVVLQLQINSKMTGKSLTNLMNNSIKISIVKQLGKRKRKAQ